MKEAVGRGGGKALREGPGNSLHGSPLWCNPKVFPQACKTTGCSTSKSQLWELVRASISAVGRMQARDAVAAVRTVAVALMSASPMAQA